MYIIIYGGIYYNILHINCKIIKDFSLFLNNNLIIVHKWNTGE